MYVIKDLQICEDERRIITLHFLFVLVVIGGMIISVEIISSPTSFFFIIDMIRFFAILCRYFSDILPIYILFLRSQRRTRRHCLASSIKGIQFRF